VVVYGSYIADIVGMGKTRWSKKAASVIPDPIARPGANSIEGAEERKKLVNLRVFEEMHMAIPLPFRGTHQRQVGKGSLVVVVVVVVVVQRTQYHQGKMDEPRSGAGKMTAREKCFPVSIFLGYSIIFLIF